MKKLFCFIITCVLIKGAVADDSIPFEVQNFENKQERIVVIPPSKADINFKLYPTQNIYVFLLLDTRNGRIWQVQWHTQINKRLTSNLSLDKKAIGDDAIPGRFELYPTTNMYNFIMLDQINGNTWQVQWSIEHENRFVYMIY